MWLGVIQLSCRPMLKVLFAASEATPFIQTGGLAEVAGSLPLALAEAGCEVRLVLPAYRTVDVQGRPFVAYGPFRIPHCSTPVFLRRVILNPRVELWLVDCPELFDRDGGPYLTPAGREWPDNSLRFATFSRVVTALAGGLMPDGWRPQLVHCHDWQTGLVPALLTLEPMRPATVFTLHNLAFRGLCSRESYRACGLPESMWHLDGLEFHDQGAFIKGGLIYADRLTTVSPTYAREIQTTAFGEGLDGVLRARAGVLSGVLNGIDTAQWDPARDTALGAPYDAARLTAKRQNKRALQARFGLPQDQSMFLLGTVTRLAEQKGIDLLLEALPGLLQHPLQFILLGSGERYLEEWIAHLATLYPQQIAYRIGFDVTLSRRMFAGLDAFAMPSRFEPCGLSQLYALRYGTVPLVRRTGGLADSVIDAELPQGTGFVFDDATNFGIGHAIWRAFQAYQHPAQWEALQHRGMAQDFGWQPRATEYVNLYRELLDERAAST